MPDASWEIVENPAFARWEPRLLRAACHDGSPFLTIRCQCGSEMHLHETQLVAAPPDAAITTLCKDCGGLLVFAPGELEGAFAQMREAGWIE